MIHLPDQTILLYHLLDGSMACFSHQDVNLLHIQINTLETRTNHTVTQTNIYTAHVIVGTPMCAILPCMFPEHYHITSHSLHAWPLVAAVAAER